jgi:hypothetical protein
VTQKFITGIPGFPCGVGVDAQHLYWTTGNESNNYIGRANKNGTGIDNQFIDPLNPVCGVTADSGHIYWAHSPGTDAASGIGRATLAGGTVESNWVNIPIGNPCGVAVNATHLFWGGGNDAIGRVDIDGDNADQEFIGGLDGYACGGAIDATSIFWSHENGNVGRANLDGSNVNDLFVTGGNEPCGVAVDSVTSTGKPSNAFTIGKLKLNKKKGTGKLAVTVPGAGQLALTGKSLKAQKATATVGGTISLKLKAAKKGKKKLKKKGRLKTTAKVTFTPNGGDPATQQKQVKLKKKRKKK